MEYVPLCIILHYSLLTCKYYKYFPISHDFRTEFECFAPNLANFIPIQLRIVDFIFRKFTNYHCAKFYTNA